MSNRATFRFPFFADRRKSSDSKRQRPAIRAFEPLEERQLLSLSDPTGVAAATTAIFGPVCLTQLGQDSAIRFTDADLAPRNDSSECVVLSDQNMRELVSSGAVVDNSVEFSDSVKRLLTDVAETGKELDWKIWKKIENATSATYVPQEADYGKELKVAAVGVGEYSGTATVESKAVTQDGDLDPATFNAIVSAYPGFDLSGVSASQAYVVDATSGTTLAKLKEAITAARNRSGADLIVVKTGEVSPVLTFSSSKDAITLDDPDPVTIVVWGDSPLVIDANGKTRAFVTTKRTDFALGNATILNGKGGGDGGAIRSAGALTLDRVAIYDSVSSGAGGAVYCESALTMANAVVAGNVASGSGGGVYVVSPTVGDAPVQSWIVNSTITGNVAGNGDGEGFGGGIYFKGMDAEFDITGELKVFNTIVVQNLSSATECDVNIYNSAFMNEAEIDGEVYRFEVPVAALIDGSGNLSSFVYWTSTYDASDETRAGTNRLYHEATPVFERDYNFETREQGDYRLIYTAASQAIDQGVDGAAVYPDGSKLTSDFTGAARICSGRVDIGAYEFEGVAADLTTSDGGVVNAQTLVAGGALAISEIEVANASEFRAGAFTMRFYASTDETFDDYDVQIGELVCPGIGADETRSVSVAALTTSLLDPGKSYYVGWRIVNDADPDDSNNVGRLSEKISLYAEPNASYPNVFSENTISVQEGCDFAVPFDSFDPALEYWFDLGRGYYEPMQMTGWFSTFAERLGRGLYDVGMKTVDPASGRVVEKGAAELTVAAVEPRLKVETNAIADGKGVRLSLTGSTAMGNPIARWVVDWGDGTKTTYGALGYELTAARLYEQGASEQTRAISVTLYDSPTASTGATFPIASFTVPGASSSATIDDVAFFPVATPAETTVFSGTFPMSSRAVAERFDSDVAARSAAILDAAESSELLEPLDKLSMSETSRQNASDRFSRVDDAFADLFEEFEELDVFQN